MTNWQDDLLAIGSNVTRILKEDTFPDSIQPDFLARAVRAYPEAGGKRLRPALLLWACELVGGLRQSAWYAATAVEVFHNWTLVHDDIIDGDDSRRGNPSCHRQLEQVALERYNCSPEAAAKFGRDMAILAGDLQQAWANYFMAKVPGDALLVNTLVRRMQTFTNRKLISGEAVDVALALRKVETIAEEEILQMIIGKTGVLFQFCAETGGAIGLNSMDFTHPLIVRLGQLACKAGIAFQLQDDYLGVFGAFQKLGKDLGSDLREGKPTLLLVRSLRNATPAGRKALLDLLYRPVYGEEELTQVQTIMEESGAVQSVLAEGRKLLDEVHTLLNTFPESPARSCYAALLEHLIARDH